MPCCLLVRCIVAYRRHAEHVAIEAAVHVQVLCSAICIFMELHERMEQGCLAAFQDFMKVWPTPLALHKVSSTNGYFTSHGLLFSRNLPNVVN